MKRLWKDQLFSLNQWVSLNVIGVNESLERISRECPQSVFEDESWKYLKELSWKYGLVISIHLKDNDEVNLLKNLNEIYLLELKRCSGWIKFGWAGEESPAYFFSVIDSALSKNSLSQSAIVKRIDDNRFSNIYSENKVDLFLIDARDVGDYEGDYADKLRATGYYRLGRVIYRVVDVFFEERMSTEYCFERFGENINAIAERTRLQVVFNIKNKRIFYLDNLFDKLPYLEKKLYINASTIVDGYMYFTVCNIRFLFRMNLSDFRVESVTDIPCKTGCIIRFSSLLYIGDELWMIPWAENDIYVYNLSKDVIEIVHIPLNNTDGRWRFRKAEFKDGIIYLLPRLGEYFVKINVLERSMKVFDISQYTGADNLKLYNGFACMFIQNDTIYISGDEHNCYIKFDIEKETFELWNVEAKGGYIEGVSKENYIVVPTFYKESIFIYDFKDNMVKKIDLPREIWGVSDKEYYWYTSVIDKYAYILPLETGYIIRYGIADNQIKIINISDVGYDAIVTNRGFTGYEVFENPVNGEIWVTSHTGNHILRIDQNGGVIGILNLYVPIKELSVTGRVPGMKETRFKDLKVFLTTSSVRESSL